MKFCYFFQNTDIHNHRVPLNPLSHLLRHIRVCLYRRDFRIRACTWVSSLGQQGTIRQHRHFISILKNFRPERTVEYFRLLSVYHKPLCFSIYFNIKLKFRMKQFFLKVTIQNEVRLSTQDSCSGRELITKVISLITQGGQKSLMQQKMETRLTVPSERVSFLSQALQLTLSGSCE